MPTLSRESSTAIPVSSMYSIAWTMKNGTFSPTRLQTLDCIGGRIAYDRANQMPRVLWAEIGDANRSDVTLPVA